MAKIMTVKKEAKAPESTSYKPKDKQTTFDRAVDRYVKRGQSHHADATSRLTADWFNRAETENDRLTNEIMMKLDSMQKTTKQLNELYQGIPLSEKLKNS